MQEAAEEWRRRHESQVQVQQALSQGDAHQEQARLTTIQAQLQASEEVLGQLQVHACSCLLPMGGRCEGTGERTRDMVTSALTQVRRKGRAARSTVCPGMHASDAKPLQGQKPGSLLLSVEYMEDAALQACDHG